MRLKKKKRVSSSSALTSQSSTLDEDSRDAERPMSWEGELSDSEMSRLDEAIVAGRGAIVAAAQANSLQVSCFPLIAFVVALARTREKKTNVVRAVAAARSPRARQGPALSRLGHCASACDRDCAQVRSHSRPQVHCAGISFLSTTFQRRSLSESCWKIYARITLPQAFSKCLPVDRFSTRIVSIVDSRREFIFESFLEMPF